MEISLGLAGGYPDEPENEASLYRVAAALQRMLAERYPDSEICINVDVSGERDMVGPVVRNIKGPEGIEDLFFDEGLLDAAWNEALSREPVDTEVMRTMRKALRERTDDS